MVGLAMTEETCRNRGWIANCTLAYFCEGRLWRHDTNAEYIERINEERRRENAS